MHRLLICLHTQQYTYSYLVMKFMTGLISFRFCQIIVIIDSLSLLFYNHCNKIYFNLLNAIHVFSFISLFSEFRILIKIYIFLQILYLASICLIFFLFVTWKQWARTKKLSHVCILMFNSTLFDKIMEIIVDITSLRPLCNTQHYFLTTKNSSQ